MKTYISLFSSAGVGCYGFRNQFQCIATNELIRDRIDVQRANSKCKYESGYICGDITSPTIQQNIYDQIALWQNFENVKQVDVVFATPPCQGMSTANYKKNDKEKIRNSLVVEAIKLIKQVQPKIFIFENVRAFMNTICTDVSGIDMPIKDSILSNLSKNYHISWKVINFKDYGVPSSRPRTIVIGTHKSFRNVSPLNLFPTRKPEITLRHAIGNLPSLEYGEKDDKDFLHFARKFPEYQLSWIKNLKEGESAFQNPIETQPYKINSDGERVGLKGAYMGNKYRRLTWDKPCSCIATRNDQLASQDTVHPVDNRVLSIRELMKLMSIPDSFKWTKNDHLITPDNADEYLKRNEFKYKEVYWRSCSNTYY
jgi:DNA (cytosine-5)-methyltransferase 1